MIKHWQYLKYVLRHKWYVFISGIRIGAPIWRLIIHDWSKFLPSEWSPYVDNFYGKTWEELEIEARDHWEPLPNISKEEFESRRKIAFDKAWNHHQKFNKHHWQYWLLTKDKPQQKFILQAPDVNFGPYFIKRPGDKENDYTSYLRVILPHFSDTKIDGAEYLILQRTIEDLITAANRSPIALPMPRKYILEMVADWMGAGWAITGDWRDVFSWYVKNSANMILHPDTKRQVREILTKLAMENDEPREESRSNRMVETPA